jgi:hypothetical protein
MAGNVRPISSDAGVDCGAARCAIDRARAAWYLLDALRYEYIQVCYVRGNGDHRPDDDERGAKIYDTITEQALEDLDAALIAAEDALRENQPAPKDGA